MVCERGMFNAFEGKVLRKIYGLEWVNCSGETGIITKYVNYTRK
jgi:hypothetical protein